MPFKKNSTKSGKRSPKYGSFSKKRQVTFTKSRKRFSAHRTHKHRSRHRRHREDFADVRYFKMKCTNMITINMQAPAQG